MTLSTVSRRIAGVVSCVCLVAAPAVVGAADLVRDGRANGQIWHKNDAAAAATDLAKTIEKMTGVAVEVRGGDAPGRPDPRTPAVVLGALALEMGLAPPPVTVSNDGYALETRGAHLLIAGESPTSTRFAVSDFLERLGCRWLTSTALGDVIPRVATVSLDGVRVREKPDFLFREVWGVPRHTARLGGLELPNRHDWEHVPAAKYFESHPEYFGLRDGQRKPSRWVCTSHPDVARIFAEAYVAKAKAGLRADTISPPDGRGFCECQDCRKLDVPGYLEPSNGALSMSDRYGRFFTSVARQVKKEAPNFLLSFYCYSDYTLPPKTLDSMSDNLVGWVTTIRFCRLHGVDNPRCESRQRYKNVVQGWGKLIQTCCYDYNYNLAEVTVPISKITYVKQNIPFLKKTGCLGINLESMSAWNLYGPHTYLAGKLMWDADADADAILADYYEKCVGPRAAPHLRAYWDRIDRAVVACDVHCGSFNCINAIWTPELYTACDADLTAADAAAGTPEEKNRVAMFRSGLENVRYWRAFDEALNRCDFAAAREVRDRWTVHMDDAHARDFNTMRGYKHGYLRMFEPMLASGLARTQDGRRLLARLPDVWDFRYDAGDEGERSGLYRPDDASPGWRPVKTYSASLNEQKIPEQLTWMWYRTKFRTPEAAPGEAGSDAKGGPLHLWFGEVDGSPTRVWLNGELLGEFTGARRPNDLEVTGKLRPGQENVLVVKTGHLSISELMLGGILRPVMLYAGAKPEK